MSLLFEGHEIHGWSGEKHGFRSEVDESGKSIIEYIDTSLKTLHSNQIRPHVIFNTYFSSDYSPNGQIRTPI